MSKSEILIIDDEIEICLNIKDMFQLEGYGADFATTAKDAFKKIDENGHKLILVDIKLEGRVSGIDIIKSFKEKPARPKLIIISAIPRAALDPTFIREGIVHLIDGFLNKPNCCDPEKLVQLAKKTLGST